MFLATCINADCGRSGPMVTKQVVISFDHATLPRLKIEEKKSYNISDSSARYLIG